MQTDSVTKQNYEWMTHNNCHEVTPAEFCDWMEVNTEVKKKISVLLHYGLKQGAFVLPAKNRWWSEFVFMWLVHEKMSL